MNRGQIELRTNDPPAVTEYVLGFGAGHDISEDAMDTSERSSSPESTHSNHSGLLGRADMLNMTMEHETNILQLQGSLDEILRENVVQKREITRLQKDMVKDTAISSPGIFIFGAPTARGFLQVRGANAEAPKAIEQAIDDSFREVRGDHYCQQSFSGAFGYFSKAKITIHVSAVIARGTAGGETIASFRSDEAFINDTWDEASEAARKDFSLFTRHTR
ncbi:hypothetical protein HJFPF1_00376 [Paramyrothecium foliicola]|nr:hypothetical protein HJFPF1_00376 [Paramyrothecium foliicola]